MAIYDITKDAISLAQKLGNMDLLNKMVDVQNSAAELYDKLNRVNEENTKLKEENIALKASLKKKDDYIPYKAAYWKKEDVNHVQPYCPSCMTDNKEMLMHKVNDSGYYHCPNAQCKLSLKINDVNKNEFQEAQLFDNNGFY